MSSIPILVRWSPEDQQFLATCEEFPSLSWLADTETDAACGLRCMVDLVAAHAWQVLDDDAMVVPWKPTPVANCALA